MILRFFVDQCVPRSIHEELRSAGHEAIVLRDHIPPESPDPVVIAKAQELSAILLSLNGDFSDIVQYPPERYGGIIAIQIGDHPEVIPHIMRRLLRFFQDHTEQGYYSGKLLLAEAHRIRIRT